MSNILPKNYMQSFISKDWSRMLNLLDEDSVEEFF